MLDDFYFLAHLCAHFAFFLAVPFIGPLPSVSRLKGGTLEVSRTGSLRISNSGMP